MHDMTSQQLSDYVDGELTTTESTVVEAHLAQCAECRTVVEQLRGIAAVAASLSLAALRLVGVPPAVGTAVFTRPPCAACGRLADGVLPSRITMRAGCDR